MVADAFDRSGNGSGRRSSTLEPMKRLFLRLASLYLLFAVIGRFVEGMGAVRCGCAPTCWCKRPLFSTFRWVFPFRHQGVSPDPLGQQPA